MKNFKLVPILLIAVSTVFMFSCKKSKAPTPTPTPAPVNANPPFSWSENGGTAKTTSNVSFHASPGIIQAINSDNLTVIQILTHTSSPGTYPVSTNIGDVDFHYTMTNYTGTSGSVIITSNSNGKISGTFNTSSTSGVFSTVTGQFTDITVQ